jgi:serine/threonine-protein kinase
VLVLLHALQRIAHGSRATSLDDPVNRLVLLLAVLGAGGSFALHHFRVASAGRVVTLGMAVSVLLAAAMAWLETSGLLREGRPLAGVSAVGAWILLVSATVPARPGIILTMGLAAASTWPIAFAIGRARIGAGAVPASDAFVWTAFNLAMAGAGYLIARAAHRAAAGLDPTEQIGSYRLVSKIGEGGMGEVWTATHRMLARSAAIKLVRPEAFAGASDRQADEFVKRFRREANAIALLQSPHTVYLYDFGVSDDGRLYYVMELLDGISLHTLVSRFGPQPASRVVMILQQVCQSLDEAHAQGLVHRDLKPSNIMLCRVGRRFDFVKVLDFGLAKRVTSPDQTQLTIAGTATGTPGYMAPEIIMGESGIDGRADIYALGCVAYFLLTGTPVFDGDQPATLALRHVQDPPPPPSARTELPIPADLEAVVLDCLQKAPGARPATARDLARRLAACRLPRWTSDEAAGWWQDHLPPTSSLRPAARREVGGR